MPENDTQTLEPDNPSGSRNIHGDERANDLHVRLRFDIAYVGTAFSGWQRQINARTIQETLENALAKPIGRKVTLHGAGRTDAGVHAQGQVAHADLPADKANLPWMKILNSLLPRDLAVTRVSRAAGDFHARFSAISKTYVYTLWLEQDFIRPDRRPFVHRTGPLDIEAMREASAHLIGKHDFAAFQNVGTDVKSTVREIFAIDFTPGLTPWETTIRFQADGFLKQMVRNITGCLIAVGKGKIPPEAPLELLGRKNRREAPAAAPACGLTLENVQY